MKRPLLFLPIIPLVLFAGFFATATKAETTGPGTLGTGPPVIHFTLARRGGSIRTNSEANLTALAEAVARAEARYGLTRREVNGNKLVRKPKSKDVVGGRADGSLMTRVGDEGTWFAILELGSPPQKIEMDLDMLSSDFYLMTTSSKKGTAFDVFDSHSFVEDKRYVHPICDIPSDRFHFPMLREKAMISLPFAHCKPSKYSRWTLAKSGAALGLAPSRSLSQIDSTPLIDQLLENNVIDHNVWSITLINGKEGVLSIGGTMAANVDEVKAQLELALEGLGKRDVVDDMLDEVLPAPEEEEDKKGPNEKWRDDWKWSPVQGAKGWWQILLEGVWIDNSKVLKNQPAVIDINSPFILAPPFAARKFYEAIPSSRRLPAPHDQFYIFPCLNPPTVHFEFGRWLFPVFQGSKGSTYYGAPGGKLSLGRLKRGSGYCVGAVVETRMGVRDESGSLGKTGVVDATTGWRGGRGGEKLLSSLAGEIAGNGMRDVWVIGETFFRGVGGVFDFKEQKVGFRTY